MQKPKTETPEIGRFLGFDHVRFYVGNALQAASFYTSRFGMKYHAYRGLETNDRHTASHVVSQNNIKFVFQSPYNQEDPQGISEFVRKHGDGVYDVAFTVENCAQTFSVAKKRGAKVVSEIQTLKDKDGEVIIASVSPYKDTIHTFVQRNNYKGVFMPGYKKHHLKEFFNKPENDPKLKFIDHIVSNQGEGDMEPTAAWYCKMLDFHRFWSVDDKIMHTEYSSLNSIVVADRDEVIKMPINEPSKGKKVSQIQEYVDYYGGPGIQHIALNTDDILYTIKVLRNRGIDFLKIPNAYYDNLRDRLKNSSIVVKEDLDAVQKLGILLDFDEQGYLLQLFTKPLEDRPTLFFEVIQRRGNQGFGAGNFKSLFKAIEDEQARRGNLVDYVSQKGE